MPPKVDVSIPIPNKFKDIAGVDCTSITTVWTPAASKCVRLMGGYISASAAVSLLFEDNTHSGSPTVFRTPVLVANTPFAFDLGEGQLLSANNNVLKLTGAATITGTLYGREEN